MSELWFYRINGREYGPVGLDLVRSLVRSEAIAPDDEVRNAARSNWILACAATELRDSLKKPYFDLKNDRRTARDQWYCQGATGEMGPLKLTELIQLAACGQLVSDEHVKATADNYWRQVGSFQRLVELLPFTDTFNPILDQRPGAVGIFPKLSSEFEETPITDDSDVRPANSPTNADQGPHSQGGNQHATDKQLDNSDDQLPNVLLFPGVVATTSTAASLISESDRSSLDDSSIDAIATATMGSMSERDKLNFFSMLDHSPSTAETDPIRIWGHQDSSTAFGNAKWTGWIGGEEFGPVDFTELLTWAVIGRLSPMDFVRRGTSGQFVPAVNIPCLFTVQAAANSLSRPAKRVENGTPAPVTNLEQLAAVPATPDQKPIAMNRRSTDRKPENVAPDARHRTIPEVATIPLRTRMAAPSDEITSHRYVTPRPEFRLRDLISDQMSVGISAILTIGLIVLGWIAIH